MKRGFLDSMRFFLVTKLRLGDAFVFEALLRRGDWGSYTPSREARLTKQSFADKDVPKLELWHE